MSLFFLLKKIIITVHFTFIIFKNCQRSSTTQEMDYKYILGIDLTPQSRMNGSCTFEFPHSESTHRDRHSSICVHVPSLILWLCHCYYQQQTSLRHRHIPKSSLLPTTTYPLNPFYTQAFHRQTKCSCYNQLTLLFPFTNCSKMTENYLSILQPIHWEEMNICWKSTYLKHASSFI